MNLVEIVGDPHVHRRRQPALDRRQESVDVVDDVQGVAGRGRVDADEDRAIAVHQHRDVGALRAEIDIRHVLEAYQCAVLRLDDHVPELIDGLEIGVGDHVGDREITFRLAGRGLIVVLQERACDIDRGHAARRHARRIEPHPHRIGLPAENVGGRDAVDRGQQRLDVARQIVRHRRGAELRRGEIDVHDAGGLPGRLDDDRVERVLRQQVADLVGLRHDVGHGGAGIVIELDVDRDGAVTEHRGRGQVVDAFGRRHGLFDRLGDEALHHLRRGARINGRHGDHRVFHLRVLPNRKVVERTQAQQQDQQADDDRQDRAADEQVGETHRR